MRNNYSLLEAGCVYGHPEAFKKNAVGKIQYYDSVAKAVSSVVGGVVDFVGDAVEAVGDAVEDVGNAVGDVVESALENPIQTIVTIAAVAAAPATGGASLYAIPATSAATVIAEGGDFDDALKAAAISYAATATGNIAGNYAGAYASSAGQSAAMQQLAAGATRAVASGATSAALSGRDVGDAMVRSLAGYGLYRGVDYAINEVGQAVDAITGQVLAEADGTLAPELTGQENLNAVDLVDYADEVGVDIDAFGREIGDVNPYATPIEQPSVGFEFDPTDYGLVPNNTQAVAAVPGYQEGDLGTGITGPTLPPVVVEADAEVDYSLIPDGTQFETGTGLKAPTTPNLATMGGGQGITADVEGGTVGETGFTADQAAPILGDPDSMINDPEALGREVMEEGSPEDNPLVKAAKDYFARQVKGKLTSNLMSDIFDTGAPRAPEVRRFGRRYMPEGMTDVAGTTISSLLGDGDTGEAAEISTADPNVDLGSDELFNPLGDASWAPQTKIGGLGFAGKFINRDSDTYYVSKEQEDRDKAREKLQSQQGWMTDEDRQQLINEAGGPDSQYYDFDQTSYDLNPWGKPSYAAGGLIDHNPEFFSEGGASLGNRYVKGNGDGTSDSVPAMLASGEFVIPADVVSGLGNGDNDAGAQVLDEFMAAIRKHKRGASPDQLPPDSKGPLSYLSEALTKSNGKRS
jgi:hypothetical protein